MCFSDAAALPALSFVGKFRDEFEFYVREGRSKVKGFPYAEMWGEWKRIEVPDGTKLIDAFKIAGEDIAHYCTIRSFCCGMLSIVYGGIKDNPGQIACNTIVQEGMEDQ